MAAAVGGRRRRRRGLAVGADFFGLPPVSVRYLHDIGGHLRLKDGILVDVDVVDVLPVGQVDVPDLARKLGAAFTSWP